MHSRIILANRDESLLTWLNRDASSIFSGVAALPFRPRFANELALRSAVAFAKWMARVQFAEKVRSAFGKLFSVPDWRDNSRPPVFRAFSGGLIRGKLFTVRNRPAHSYTS